MESRKIMHTLRFSSIGVSDVRESECVVFAVKALEERGSMPIWDQIKNTSSRSYVEISDITQETIVVSTRERGSETISLRDQQKLESIVSSKSMLLDITGLPYNVWAPLFRAAFLRNADLRVLYAEPQSYTLPKHPSSSAVFELTSEY